ncbi:geranylgeranylglyceryl/heptaprenylglyceryl phosphate synthase [Marinilongibacter aquaticus]|uniref:geranylgeranylglyceryl/heptaprenylglyceryl phosphate synthase n=1 Tax=Marinilongibacter aquaticus TaxID=2975157 RepID=UPI0021BD25E0|nr:geranylgeranylglyceryl/heptaprenylglyceryl phosphate synthase [Marinilongibacter aquaticus]UBM59781.1 geranylgeranylglyceryl/heptaprenylglyceryl phosphate synthase [Marinilongibacter aquaticus]
MTKVLDKIRKQSKKSLAILIDPDKVDEATLDEIILLSIEAKVSFFFVGGSLISSDQLDFCIQRLKEVKDIPTVLFPGNGQHVHAKADAILLLSLISGRNADFLIGQHVIAAPALKRSGLEILPTGYMLVDGGKQTTASYISNTTPLPNDKPDIAAATALAGEMLGLKILYLDAGSGAKNTVSSELISAVKNSCEIPLIVGGGIDSLAKAEKAFKAGADIIVVGNATEKDPQFISDLGQMMDLLEIRGMEL